ncbi:MAG: FMN-binding protein [bacterium]|nr:FMN-binding protein [bacterium]
MAGRCPRPCSRFHRASRGGRNLGWALVLEEKGRFKPITFLVHMGPDRRVAAVLVMVYRESRGDAVRRARFLDQFDGKDADDPLRLNRDVVGISGATLSSRALAAGVRKALLLAEARYGGQP